MLFFLKVPAATIAWRSRPIMENQASRAGKWRTLQNESNSNCLTELIEPIFAQRFVEFFLPLWSRLGSHTTTTDYLLSSFLASAAKTCNNNLTAVIGRAISKKSWSWCVTHLKKGTLHDGWSATMKKIIWFKCYASKKSILTADIIKFNCL